MNPITQKDCEPLARIVVVSGPSGSGKSRLARQLSRELGWPFVNLDDFYRDHDAPNLPHLANGEINWDDAFSWDRDEATRQLDRLCHTGTCDIPEYSITRSRREGERILSLDGARHVVVEGIFAPDVIQRLADLGLLEAAWCLQRNRTVTAGRRLVRDVAERRKPPRVLVTRGIRLWRQEPALVAAHTARGAEPLSLREALRRAHALGRGESVAFPGALLSPGGSPV